MTAKEMAEGLRAAEVAGDEEAIAEYENEICAHLNLPLDWTEQGLNWDATQAIYDFCAAQGVEVAAAMVFDVKPA